MIQKFYVALFAAFALTNVSCKKSIDKKITNEQTTVPTPTSLQNVAFLNLQMISYTFTKVFDIATILGSQQGLSFGNGYHYIAWDAGNGYGRISQYDGYGNEVKRTGKLALGHSAEASYRRANGKLYIANGGLTGSPTHIFEVDMSLANPVVVRSFDFSSMGSNGLVAVDNSEGRLLVFAGPNGGPYTVATADFKGTILNKFIIVEKLGTPQGIEIFGNEILYYTSLNTTPKSNQITVFSTSGVKQYTIPVPIEGEGQGLSINEDLKAVYIGTIKTNKVHKMIPVFRSNAILGKNLLFNPNAEGGANGTSFAYPVPVPFWSVSNATVLYYGKSGSPSATSPGSPNRRSNYFSGSAFSKGIFTQRIDVSNLSAEIDAGLLLCNLKGWLGGLSTQDDNAMLTSEFQSEGGSTLGTMSIGPVLAKDRNSVTGMVKRSVVGLLPKGTRFILATLTMTRAAGTNCDGFADDLSLILTQL